MGYEKQAIWIRIGHLYQLAVLSPQRLEETWCLFSPANSDILEGMVILSINRHCYDTAWLSSKSGYLTSLRTSFFICKMKGKNPPQKTKKLKTKHDLQSNFHLKHSITELTITEVALTKVQSQTFIFLTTLFFLFPFFVFLQSITHIATWEIF